MRKIEIVAIGGIAAIFAWLQKIAHPDSRNW